MAGTKPEIKEMAKGITSYDIVNAARLDSETGMDFTKRIPECNQNNLKQIGEILYGDSDLANIFLPVLLNRIGLTLINQRVYTNRLKGIRYGRLEYGQYVEEVAFGLVKGKCDYNPDEGVDDVFAITRPEVAAAIHKVNFQQKWPTSFDRYDLRKAFTSEKSLGDFINGVITALYNSFEVDEQLAYKQLCLESIQQGFMKMVTVPEPVDEATGKTMVKRIKAFANNATFMSTAYNKYGIPQFSRPEDLVIIIRADIDAEIEVDVLAAAFQSSAVNFVGAGRKILIDDFGDPNVYAIVADRRFFQIYENDISLDKIYNPSNRVWNYFLHVWEVISASPFMNAIALVGENSGTVTGVTVTPATGNGNANTSIQFSATVTGTGLIENKVTWSVSPDTNSSITTYGKLMIGAETTGTKLTVTATSTQDPSKTGTSTITIA